MSSVLRTTKSKAVLIRNIIRTASYLSYTVGVRGDFGPISASKSCSIAAIKTARPSWHYLYQKPALSRCIRRFASVAEETLENPDCDVNELKRKLDGNGAYVIDVRTPEELVETGRIPGAINIVLTELEAALKLPVDLFKARYEADKPSKDGDSLVFQCRSGVRSLTALRIARKLGYEKSRHLPGGILLWKEKYEQLIK